MFGKRLRLARRHRSPPHRLIKSRHAAIQPLEERRLLAIDAFDLSALAAQRAEEALERADPVSDSTASTVGQRQVEQVAQSVADGALGRITSGDTFYLLRNVITVSQGNSSFQIVSSEPASQAFADPELREQVALAGIDLASADITSIPTLAYSGDPEAIQPLTEVLAVAAAAQSQPEPEPEPQTFAARAAFFLAASSVSISEQAAIDAGLVGPVFLTDEEVKSTYGDFSQPSKDELPDDSWSDEEPSLDPGQGLARLAQLSSPGPSGPDDYEFLTGPTTAYFGQAMEFKLHIPPNPESITREVEIPYTFHVDWGNGAPAETLSGIDDLPVWYRYEGTAQEAFTISVDLFIDDNLNNECDPGEEFGHSTWEVDVSLATFDAPQQALITENDPDDDPLTIDGVVEVTITLQAPEGSASTATFDFVIDWGDGSQPEPVSDVEGGTDVAHEYDASDVYAVTVTRQPGAAGETVSVRQIAIASVRKQFNVATSGYDLVFDGSDASEFFIFGNGSAADEVDVYVSIQDDFTAPDFTAVGIDGVLIINGGGGNDFLLPAMNSQHRIVLDAGDGNDMVMAGSLDTTGSAEPTEIIQGGPGNDSLVGSAGHDRLSGGAGNDMAVGAMMFSGSETDGDNELFGDEGDDILVGAAGNDSLHGGEGSDLLVGGVSDDTLYGNAGKDVLIGGVIDGVAADGADLLEGGDGDDALMGGWYTSRG